MSKGNTRKGIERVKAHRQRVERGGYKVRSVGHKPLPDDSDPAALVHHARPYLDHLTAHNYSPCTIERREQALKRFLGWTLERGIAQPRLICLLYTSDAADE